MYSKSIGTESPALSWLDFDLGDITGTWESREGAPRLRIFRNEARKGGCLYLELTYNKPQAVFACPIRACFGIRYFDLYGRVGLAYDGGRDVLLLSSYGEYNRVPE